MAEPVPSYPTTGTSFHMGRTSPLVFQTLNSEHQDRLVALQQQSLQPAPQDLPSPSAYQQTYRPCPVTAAEFGFQPDPQQEGRWISAPQPSTMMEQLAFPPWEYSQCQQFMPADVVQCQSNFGNFQMRPIDVTEAHTMPRTYSMSSMDSTASRASQPSSPPDRWYALAPRDPYHGSWTEHQQFQGLGLKSPLTSIYSSDTDQKPDFGLNCTALKEVPHSVPIMRSAKRPYQCKRCHESFSKRKLLADHDRAHHRQKEDRFICDFCNKDYGRHADLSRHIRSKHNGDEFPCKWCRNSFNRSDIVRRHEDQSCKVKKKQLAGSIPIHSTGKREKTSRL